METKDPRKTFGEALIEVGEQYENVIALSADSCGGSGMAPFRERFPQRHVEFGIMEQGVMGFASGLALMGKIPFFAAIAPFITGRAFEMFRNDVGYMGQNVKAVGRCAGLAFSNLGPTHVSHDDIALIRTIPGVAVVAPGDPVEIKKAVHAACEMFGPVYIRIGGPPMPVLFDSGYDFTIGKGVVMRDGEDVTLIGSGAVLSKALAASEKLKAQGVSARMLNLHTIKPIDEELIVRAARETGRIVTVEEHSIVGGLGSAVSEVIASHCPVQVAMIGINDTFVSNGPYEELLGVYGLQVDQIVQTTKELLKQKNGAG
jgi:transketolase